MSPQEKWRQKNMDKVRAAARRRYWRNHKQRLAAGAKWRSENREKSRIAARRWQANHPEKVKQDHAKWRSDNLDKRCATQMLRKAMQLNATPAWANEFFIKEIYHLSKLRTKHLGSKWHVDHIVPLKSNLVCGLHVENNLQVIPAAQNIKKQNIYWPEMP